MTDDTTPIAHWYEQYVMPTYLRVGLTIARGRGSSLWDTAGRRYLDFFPGWGVSSLGHCPPAVVRAVRQQVGTLIHVPNSCYHAPQARLAKGLVESAFDGKVFFSNSGAEAVEGAIKLVRRWGNPSRWEIITMRQSFHGRTLGALAATGQSKYQQGFQPLPPGFKTAPFNDLEAVIQAITPHTAAVMLEPIQGEGGIHVATPAFLKGLRQVCDRRNLLLIFDEIQTGFGRTGTLFAYQHDGVVPDILLLAKAIAGGLPMGAILARRPIADTLTAGTHAATFGGSPLVCAAALAVLATVKTPAFLKRVRRQGEQFRGYLETLQARHPAIQEIRGRGLMFGLQLDRPGAPIVEHCRRHGLLINCTQDRVLRLMPALTVAAADLTAATRLLDAALTECRS
ncbi:MAG: acetylornithine aminotransferase [Omnitrophica WOR_2 bacterium RIFCSPHIGHO2_02_FULL_68_15]|nr:MAG: acetylornithine aminotransferase [Omnitrophica WOR_2 bacterium RIFCSPHIGHO2_02_FULL_68_15]